MQDILKTITKLREQRGWTEYQLAEHSGLPQSTISSWYRKNMVPTIPSLEKICSVFGVTLPALLSYGDEPVTLTESQKRLLNSWAVLTVEQQDALLHLLDSFQAVDEQLRSLHNKSSDYSETLHSGSVSAGTAYFEDSSLQPSSPSILKVAEHPCADLEISSTPASTRSADPSAFG